MGKKLVIREAERHGLDTHCIRESIHTFATFICSRTSSTDDSKGDGGGDVIKQSSQIFGQQQTDKAPDIMLINSGR